MPEVSELEFERLQAQDWYSFASTQSDWDLELHDIFLDVSEAERGAEGCSTRLQGGYVDTIANAMGTMRGSKSIQTHIFPPMFENLDALRARHFRLTGMESSGHSIILVFGELLCQVRGNPLN